MMNFILETVAFSVVAVSILFLSIYGIIQYTQYRDSKNREISAYLDIISSLTPGSVWIERDDHLPLNPFMERDPAVATIIETRKDIYGELWVAYELNYKQNHTYVDMACDFVDVYKLSTNYE